MENTNSSLKDMAMSKHARFIGIDTVTYEKGKVYPVIGYEHGLFRVDNLDGEDYVLPPKVLNLFILHDLQERPVKGFFFFCSDGNASSQKTVIL